MQKQLKSFFQEKDIIYKYTSQQATEDGLLLDVDIILPKAPGAPFFLKYITSGLLEKGYFKERCKNGVKVGEQGINDRCSTCPTWIEHTGEKLSCTQQELNKANLIDLLFQAQKIFQKKPADDYFVSGRIELPDGSKQKIFIAQNETGRYTAMLPEEY